MRVAGLMWTILALAASAAEAAPPPEPVVVRIVAVDVAGREIEADGVTWALESTAAIHMPGDDRAALGDLLPGMHARLDLAPTDGDQAPLVRTITVLPD